jgi:uncharacterized protein YdaT
MKIGDIIKKVLSGEALSDDEKGWLGAYDEQGAINAAAAKARREAEAKAAAALEALETLKAESSKTVEKKDADYTALSERVKALEAAKSESDAKLAKIDRTAKIRAAFEKAGIKAAKGVSEAAFAKLVEVATESVDVNQEESLKTATQNFRTEYAGVIASDGAVGTGRTNNKPSLAVDTKDNPWAKGNENLTKQCEIALADPAKAQEMARAAHVL